MPCRVLDEWGDGPDRKVRVEAPNGEQYVYLASDLLGVEAGIELIRRNRIEAVVNGYRFEQLSAKPAVWAVTKPGHKAASYTISTGRAGRMCTCPAWERTHDCKHLQGLALLQEEASWDDVLPPAPVPTPAIPDPRPGVSVHRTSSWDGTAEGW